MQGSRKRKVRKELQLGKYGSQRRGSRKHKHLEFRKMQKSQDAGKDTYREGTWGKPNFFQKLSESMNSKRRYFRKRKSTN